MTASFNAARFGRKLRAAPRRFAVQTAFERPALIFVQTPADVAYDMYRAREAQGALTFSYREFLEVYDAPVESGIPNLGRKAQVYTYNSGSFVKSGGWIPG